MLPPRPRDGSRIVVLSGAGLSAASGIPTFRDVNGLWEGVRVEDVATPEAWARDPQLVQRFYDVRRVNCVHVLPNPAHDALARLQHRWGARRVFLVTQNIDGLLHKAGAADVVEVHGSLWSIMCEADIDHPHVQIAGPMARERKCAMCGAAMRPDVVWFGEMPRFLDRVHAALAEAEIFMAVGTSGVVWPAAGFIDIARQHGARCIEVNPVPTGGKFDEVIAQPAEDVLPAMVAEWLEEPERVEGD